MTLKPEYGLIGIGSKGAALALNIADKGNCIAVSDRTPAVTDAFVETAAKHRGGPCAAYMGAGGGQVTMSK